MTTNQATATAAKKKINGHSSIKKGTAHIRIKPGQKIHDVNKRAPHEATYDPIREESWQKAMEQAMYKGIASGIRGEHNRTFDV